MNELDRRFWPFKPRTSIVSRIAILVVLLLVFLVLRLTIEWPGKESQTTVLIGILLLSLLPILFALVDAIFERGGVIKAGDVEIDFSQVPKMGASALTVRVNVGVPIQPFTDSGSTGILDALRQATACDVVIIDLVEEHALRETRSLALLVL